MFEEVNTSGQGNNKKKKKKYILFIIIGIVVIIFLVGGVCTYIKWKNSPEIIFNKAINNLQQWKSVHYQGSLVTKIEDNGNKLKGNNILNFDFISNNIKISFSGDINNLGNSKKFLTNIVVDSLDEKDNNIDLNLIRDHKIYYIKINSLPTFLSMFIADIKDWIKIDLKKILKDYNIESKGNKVEEAMVELKNIDPFSYISSLEKVKVVKKDGDTICQYHFVINPDKLSKLQKDLRYKISEKQENDNLNIELSGDIWISKNEYQIKKISTQFIEKEKDWQNVNNLEMFFSDYNKDIEIKVPDQALDLEKIIDDTQQKFSMNNGMGNNYTNISNSKEEIKKEVVSWDLNDDDKDGLSASEEKFYGTNPNNPDSDGDTYLDGKEVENGYNPNGEGKLPDNLQGGGFFFKCYDIIDLATKQNCYVQETKNASIEDCYKINDGINTKYFRDLCFGMLNLSNESAKNIKLY